MASVHDRLLDAATVAFSTVGYEAASTREIERAAGVGRSLVAHHFGTKEDLWKASVARLVSEFRAEMQRAMDVLAHVSTVERARALLQIYISFVARHPEYTRLMILSGNGVCPRTRWLMDIWRRPNIEFYVQVTGERIDDPLTQAAIHFAFVGAVSYVFAMPAEVQQLFGVSPTDPVFVEQFTDMVLGWLDLRERDDGTVSSALGRAAAASRTARTGGRR
jgi:TetR/AcrR family transcriptional regulator